MVPSASIRTSDFPGGGYDNLSMMIDSLEYLGITRLRDGMAANPEAQPVLDGLADAGYQFDFLIPASLPASGSAGLQQYPASRCRNFRQTIPEQHLVAL